MRLAPLWCQPDGMMKSRPFTSSPLSRAWRAVTSFLAIAAASLPQAGA
jgi:hypothetical protein